MGANGIYGLSGSGIDIESMVKVGMMSKQNEYDKMAQKYTKNEWMKSAYIELSSSISTFNLTKLSDYKMTASMKAKTAVSSSDAVKATANASADFRTHNVEVTNLVSNAALVGTNKMTRYAITSDTASQSSMKLADVLFRNLTKTDNGYVYGQLAAVDMANDTRDPAANSTAGDGMSLTDPYTFGKAKTSTTFANATWDADNNRFTAESGALYTNAVTWSNSDTTNWKYDDTNGWQHRVATTTTSTDPVTGNPIETTSYSWENTMIDFSTATWDATTNTFTTANGFTTNEITWSTNSDEWIKDGNNKYTEIARIGTSTDAFSFTIGDGTKSKEIHYSYDDLLNGKTFYDLVNDINNASLNIKASYDSEYDRFSFYNTKDGSGNNISITLGADDGIDSARSALVTRNFFTNMGLYQSENGKLIGNDGNAAEEDDSNYLLFKVGADNTVEGKDATIKIDGMSYKSSDNKITRDGITYEAVAETTSPARISVSQDVDAIVDKVKSFVEDYNKLLSSLYEKYDEKPDSNYKPLTQAQKDSMKE